MDLSGIPPLIDVKMGVFSFVTALTTRNVIDGSHLNRYLLHMPVMASGDVPERSKGADCKSVCQRFESARRLF